MILDEEVSLGIYAWLFEKKDILFISIVVFLHPEVKRPSAMVYILWNFENSENMYEEVTSQMSGCQGQSKGARFTIKIGYCFVLKMQLIYDVFLNLITHNVF